MLKKKKTLAKPIALKLREEGRREKETIRKKTQYPEFTTHCGPNWGLEQIRISTGP